MNHKLLIPNVGYNKKSSISYDVIPDLIWNDIVGRWDDIVWRWDSLVGRRNDK